MSNYQPEKLVRGMYGERPDVPPIEQGNDIDAPFETGSPNQGIPADLLAIIHQAPSKDPEPESEPVKGPIDVDAVNEANPNSRFRVVDVPVLAPGTCILCKSPGGDGRQFIDLSIQVTWVGALYFCTECITEAASLVGLVNMAAERDRINAMWDVTQEMDGDRISAIEENNALKLLLRDHLNGDCAPSTEPIVDADIVETDSEPEPNDPDSNESLGKQESGDLPEFASYEQLVQQQPSAPKSRRRSSKPAE